ncbi:hypothetical protein TOPH_06201 [Tolypocladium ophioglossoides CBS 100239]|uniref:Sacsin n=1 Tax=Tolypocladium ophioglossoides (strain CBS 100239) TaxID=1163406 RepID=A0A0L0N5C0_TOLOC|nr:hypothetical protein TOPH_06201 [Tolypocladium ophioglossoides CBS 100239]
MLSRTTARQLVEEIGRSHGYIRQEVLDRMSEADRLEVQQAMLMKDQLIASSVTTLARNLYTSNARFVFELLQNADDNHYTTARANGEGPYVLFHVHPDRVIMDCNEDGFTQENLTAICNVGKSSKTGAQGYIGEKGIGFKSVFMAACKVHIQSGNFSFFFQHRHGDSGMITPVWQDFGDGLGSNFTRITLFLHDDGDADTVAKQRQTMREQFQDIHETILLFMRNIQKINIAFHDDYDDYDDDDETATSTISFSMDRPTCNRATVTKSTSQEGKRDEDVRHYHMTKYVATNLAKNENQICSELEEASRAYFRGEVVLAFPLSAQAVPVIENQWVFAFLPVRQMGFKFLIQADFVTQANMQDVVTTSVRNQRLVDGIADAFITAVQQLCEHDTLQYQWMRYLPKKEDYPWDDFWTSLLDKIGARLRSTPVLRPANGGALRLIKDLRVNAPIELDRNEKPLFSDISPEIYLSLRYRWGTCSY